MRRLLLSTAFVLAVCAWGSAQVRGGRMGAAPAGHFGASRAPVVVNRAPAFTQRSGIVIRTSPSRSYRTSPSRSYYYRHYHRRFYPYYSTWYSYAPYGYYGGYYPFWDSSSLSYQSTSSYDETGQLYSEINRLSNEVESLREEQQARAYAPPPPPPAHAQEPPNSPPAEPTTLVFRDQRRQRVQNYAIVGQTLWIFDEQRARKVPLDEIDVAATTKLNEDQGVEFRAPASSHQP